jgi:hypothetical protein
MAVYMIGYDLHPSAEKTMTSYLRRLKQSEVGIGIASIQRGWS